MSATRVRPAPPEPEEVSSLSDGFISGIFDRYDGDGSRHLEPGEQLGALRQLGLEFSPELLGTIISKFDADRDGRLDLSEFSRLARSVERIKRAPAADLEQGLFKVKAERNGHLEKAERNGHLESGQGDGKKYEFFDWTNAMHSKVCRLPDETVYVLAMLGPCIRKPSDYDWTSSKLVFGKERRRKTAVWSSVLVTAMLSHTYLLLFFHYVLSVLILFRLSGSATVPEEGTCPTDQYLRYACLMLFISHALMDIGQSLQMLEWNMAVPTVRRLMVIKGMLPPQNAEQQEAELDPEWGLLLSHKVVNVVLVILPKIAIALVLLATGVSLIGLADSNQSIIIDTFAVSFVIDIDEMLFKFFASDFVREALQSIPPARVDLEKQVEKIEKNGLSLRKVDSEAELIAYVAVLKNALGALGVGNWVLLVTVSALAYWADTAVCGGYARGFIDYMGI